MNAPNKDQDPIGAYLFAARDSAENAIPDEDAEETETPDHEEDANDGEDALENRSSDEQEETDANDEDEDSTQEERDANKKGVGYDKMLEAIQEKFGDDGVKSFKSLQARTTRAEQRASEIEKLAEETREMLAELDRRTKDDEPEEDGEEAETPDEFEEIISRIKDPEQKDLFVSALNAFLKSKGVVTKSDQELEKQQNQISQIASEANKRGVETFGEEFGKFDGDKFMPNPDYVKKAAPILHRVQELGALTHEDLAWITMGPEIKQKAFEAGKAAAEDEFNKKNNGQVARAKKLNGFAKKSSGGSSNIPVYDRNDPKQVGDIRGYMSRIRERLDKVGGKV